MMIQNSQEVSHRRSDTRIRTGVRPRFCCHERNLFLASRLCQHLDLCRATIEGDDRRSDQRDFQEHPRGDGTCVCVCPDELEWGWENELHGEVSEAALGRKPSGKGSGGDSS